MAQMAQALNVLMSAGHSEPSDRPAPARLNVPSSNDGETDPNKVRVNITQGSLDNRMTLPREIFIKSRRDSYVHADREVTDPDSSYVIVDGQKYYQTNNQGRSGKIQASTFGATQDGQVLVLMREKGNRWTSAIKGGKGGGVAKGTKKGGISLKAKGQSAGRFQVAPPSKGKAVVPPQKAKAKSTSTNNADAKEALQDALRLAVGQIQENAENGFVNKAIEQAQEKRNADEPTPRMYLNTKQNRALRQACEDAGRSILSIDPVLRKHFKW